MNIPCCFRSVPGIRSTETAGWRMSIGIATDSAWRRFSITRGPRNGRLIMRCSGGEETVSFAAAEVRTTYSDQQEESAALRQNETFLFVRDTAVDVSDIQFAVDGEVVTGYVKVYDEPPVVRQLEASGSDA